MNAARGLSEMEGSMGNMETEVTPVVNNETSNKITVSSDPKQLWSSPQAITTLLNTHTLTTKPGEVRDGMTASEGNIRWFVEEEFSFEISEPISQRRRRQDTATAFPPDFVNITSKTFSEIWSYRGTTSASIVTYYKEGLQVFCTCIYKSWSLVKSSVDVSSFSLRKRMLIGTAILVRLLSLSSRIRWKFLFRTVVFSASGALATGNARYD